ncbi:MAG: ATP-dependent RNA helicase, partial [Myxococcales bacterium]|nr:ATP-dependent RNA helicase [Myxococcales bacterium]
MSSAIPTTLPIAAALPEVIAALRAGASVVIEAPPGAGKTTGLPLALLEAGFAERGDIIILQPRRLAARMAAERVAELLGETPGGRVGYQVRFDARVGPDTRVRFMTEGLLTRRLRDDPSLAGVAVVVLDEFHERHVDGDLCLALLKRLALGARPNLSIVVMSATLDGQPIRDYLSAPDPVTGAQRPAARVVSEGRAYPVAVEHSSAADTGRPLENQVLRALHRLLEDPGAPAGDVLVFLPGAREIRAAAAACEGLARVHELLVLPLHGELPPREQDRAVRPASRRKLILSTNVAETSVTIDGVVAVIDSGLHRLATHDPWSGVASLQVRPIARDSATQRAGRAGRTRPGLCLRLYTQADHDRRPEHTTPEIRRLELAGALLDLYAFGVDEEALVRFPWFEAPRPAALSAARALLRQLEAVDARGRLTDVGRALLRYPVHPRLARLIVAGRERDVADLACGAAALLSERSIYARRGAGPPRRDRDADSDLLVELEHLDAFAERGAAAARAYDLSTGTCRRVQKIREQLRRLAGARRGHGRRSRRDDADADALEDALEAALAARETALCQAALAAYPDRVAQVRDDGQGRVLVLCGGGSARLSASSVVRSAEWVVALSVASRRETDARAGREAVVDRACAIDPDWLLELPGELLADHEELRFHPTRARVEGRSELRYGALVLTRDELARLPARASEL